MDRIFYFEFSTTIRTHLSDQTLPNASRARIAVFARKAADLFKQGDPAFSYEWFFGACGLDSRGELPPKNIPPKGSPVRWDPQLKDFRRD